MNSVLRIRIQIEARNAYSALSQLQTRLNALKKSIDNFASTSNALATSSNKLAASEAKLAEAASKVAVAEAKAEVAKNRSAESAIKLEVANNNLAISNEKVNIAQAQSEVAAAKSAAAQTQAAVAAERLAIAQNQNEASTARLAAAQTAAETAAARLVAAENAAAASAERLTAAENAAVISGERLTQAQSATEAAASRAAIAETNVAVASERLSTAQNATAVSAERVAQAQNNTASSASRMAVAANQETASLERVTTEANRASLSHLRLKTAQTAAASSSKGLRSSLGDYSAHLIKSGKDTQWLGNILTQNFTLPLGIATAVGAKWALSFESEVTQVRKVYGDLNTSQVQVNHDVGLLSQAFMALSNIFGVHSEEVAHIGAVWAQAGAKGTQLAKATRSTVEAMLLGELDAETAANGLITLMTAYQLSSDELTGALATLNIVENETTIGFAGLLEVMQDSALVAKNAGVSIRELAALGAALVPVAGNATEAGNALKAIIPRVMVPRTREQAAAFKRLGVDVKSASYASATFTERLQMISKGWQELDQNTKLDFASRVFGLHQVDRGVAILDDLVNKNGQYAKALAVSGDETRNLAQYQSELQAVLESQPGQFKIATNRLRNFLTQAVIPLLPAINTLLAGLVALTQWFSHLPRGIQLAGISLLFILALAGPITKAYGLMRIMLGGVLSIFKFLIPATLGQAAADESLAAAQASVAGTGFLAYAAMFALAGVGALVGYAIGGAEGALWGVAAALTVVALTIGGVPAAVAAVVATIVALGYTIYKHWDQIPGFFSKLMQNVVQIVAKGVSFLPKSWQIALQGVINILAKAGQIIYKLLSWLNPFARHSPSLVEQVLDGTAAIAQAYDRVATSVSGSMRRVISSVRQLGAEIANAKAAAQAQELADNIKSASLAGANPDTIRSITADIENMKAGAQSLDADIKAQTDTVANWKDQLDAANKTLDVANDQLKSLQGVVSDLDDEISASKTRLQNWLETPISGTYAFEDALFANDQAQKSLQLQMARLEQQFLAAGTTLDDVRKQMEDEAKAAQDAATANNAVGDSLLTAGLTADQATDRMARLRAEIETLRGEQLDLRLQGAGSDVLAGIQGQIDQSEAVRKDLAKIVGKGGDSSSSTPVPQHLKDMVAQYDDLKKQLDKLSNEGQILDLEKALALEPAQKAIKDTQRVAEQSFGAILSGIQSEMAAQKDLNARREEAVKAVEAQQAAVDQLTAARDALQATYDVESNKLKQLEDSYRSLTDAITEAQNALDEAIKLGEEIQKQKDAAGGSGGPTPGDFGLPIGTGAGLGNEPLGDLQALVDDLQKQMEDAFKSPFKKLGDKVSGWLAPVRDKLHEFRDWFRGFFGDLFANGIGNGFEDLADRLFGPGFGAKLRGAWDAAWSFLKEDVWGPFAEHVLPAVDRFVANMKEKLGPLIDAFSGLWDAIRSKSEEFWAMYGPFITFAFGLIVTYLMDVFMPRVEAAWDFFTRIIGRAIDWVSGVLGGWITFFTGWINVIAGFINGDWTQIWEGVKQMISGVWQGIHATISFFLGAIIDYVRVAFTMVWHTVQNLWNDIGSPIFSSIWNWINDNWISKVIGMGQRIADGFRGALDAIGGFASGLRSRLANGVNSAIGVLNGFLTNINNIASRLGINFRVGLIGYVGTGNSGEGPIGNNAMPFATGGVLPESQVGGGFITNRARAIVGEGSMAYPEFVIPTDPKHRSRALKLVSELVRELGMASGGVIPRMASGGLLGGLVGGVVGSTADKVATKIWDGAVSTARGSMSRVGGVAGALGGGALEHMIVDVGNNVINKWLMGWVKQRAASILSIFGVGKSGGTSSGFGTSVGALASGGVVPPHIYQMANGAIVKGGHGGVLAHIGEGNRDELVKPLPSSHKGEGGNTYHFHGDLVLPNIKSGDDAQAFLDNLEALAS